MIRTAITAEVSGCAVTGAQVPRELRDAAGGWLIPSPFAGGRLLLEGQISRKVSSYAAPYVAKMQSFAGRELLSRRPGGYIAWLSRRTCRSFSPNEDVQQFSD